MPVSHSRNFCGILQIPARLGDRLASMDRRRSRSRGGAAERAQEIDRAAIALRQCAAVADPCHLRAAASKFPCWAGMWNRYFGFAGSVTSMIDVPLIGLSGERIERLWHLRRAAVMADIGDVTFPVYEWWADRRCVPAGRSCRPGACPWLRGGSPTLGAGLDDCDIAGAASAAVIAIAVLDVRIAMMSNFFTAILQHLFSLSRRTAF